MIQTAPDATGIVLQLKPPLHKIITSAGLLGSCANRIHAELERLCAGFGIPQAPQIQLAPMENGNGGWHPFRLRIYGVDAPFGWELLAVTRGWITATPAEYDADGKQLSSWLAASGKAPDLTVDFLVVSCAEIIKQHLPLLLEGETFRACCDAVRQARGLPEPSDGLQEHGERFHAALREFLSLGLRLSPLEEIWDAVADLPIDQDKLPLETILALRKAAVIEIRLPLDYLRQITSGRETLQEALSWARETSYNENGVPLPPIVVAPDETLKPATFQFRMNGTLTPAFTGLLQTERFLNDTADHLASMRVPARSALNPANGRAGAILQAQDADKLREQGWTTWGAPGYLALVLGESIRRRLHFFIDTATVNHLLRTVRPAYPRATAALESVMSPGEIARVLRPLAHEQVPIRNMHRICELLVEAIYSGTGDLIAAVRGGLRREITAQYARASVLSVYLMDNYGFAQFPSDPHGKPTAADEQLRQALEAEILQLPANVLIPVILASKDLRPRIHEALRHAFPRMAVLAHEEVDPEINIQPIARISSPAWIS